MDKESVGSFIDANDSGASDDASIDGNGTGGEPIVTGGASADAGEWINGFPTVEPTDIAGSSSASGSGGTRRRRGRPPGSGNTRKQTQKASIDLSGIEGLLLSVHLMGAAILNTPSLMLAEDEAKKLASALAKVQAHYDIAASAKTLAWANLAMVAGGIYGSRLVAHYMTGKDNQQKPGPKTVPIDKSVKDTATSPLMFGQFGAALPQ